MRYLILLLVLALVGCSTMPNNVTRTVSSFDGTVEYVMQPGVIFHDEGAFSSGTFQLGLFWRSDMGERIQIIARVPMHIVNIDGLHINIDGDVVSLRSGKVFTDHDVTPAQHMTFTESERMFAADLGLIRRMISAESVKVRLDISSGYLEGDFKISKPTAAIRGFPAALEAIDAERAAIAQSGRPPLLWAAHRRA